MVSHFENTVSITFRDIAHDVLVKLGVGLTSTLLYHAHPLGVTLTSLHASECRITRLAGVIEQLQIARTPAQAVKSIVGLLPNRILPAEVSQLVVTFTLYVIGVLLGYLRSRSLGEM